MPPSSSHNVSALGAAAALIATSPSLACEDWEPERGALVPSSASGAVPINTSLWWTVTCPTGGVSHGSDDVTLVDLDLGPIPLAEAGRAEDNPEALVLQLQPATPLLAGHEYEARFPRSADLSTGDGVVSFRVEDRIDDDIPSVPVLTLQSARMDLPALYNAYSEYGADGLSDPTYNDELVLDVSGGQALTALYLEGSEESPPLSGFAGTFFAPGQGLVTVADDLHPGRRIGFRVGTFAFAGQWSGWSEPTWVTLPAAGCASGPGALIVFAPWFLLRRPRRSTPLLVLLMCSLAAPAQAQTPWKDELRIRWTHERDIAAVGFVASGAFAAGATALVSFRAPLGLQVALVSQPVAAGICAVFLENMVELGELQRAATRGELRRRLLVRGATLGSVGMSLLLGMIPLGIFILDGVDPAIVAATSALPVSMLTAAVTAMQRARDLDRIGLAPVAATPSLRVIAAGPSALVLSF